jgi:hypothetical protein
MSKPRDERQKDLFQPALDQIIDMGHPVVRLAAKIDWKFLEQRLAAVCTTGPRPATAAGEPVGRPQDRGLGNQGSGAWWWRPPCSPRQLPIRPTPS